MFCFRCTLPSTVREDMREHILRGQTRRQIASQGLYFTSNTRCIFNLLQLYKLKAAAGIVQFVRLPVGVPLSLSAPGVPAVRFCEHEA